MREGGCVGGVFGRGEGGHVGPEGVRVLVGDVLLLKVVDNPEQATKDMVASSAFAEMDENSDGKITASLGAGSAKCSRSGLSISLMMTGGSTGDLRIGAAFAAFCLG